MKSTLCKRVGDLHQKLTTLNDHLTENVRFGVPFRISDGAKMVLELQSFHKKTKKRSPFIRRFHPLADPAFHETPEITLPLELTGFQNVIF